MGFSGEFGEIIHFAVVTIFQRFFSLCILYGTIIRPEHIYFVYHIYAVMDWIRILQSAFCSGETDSCRFSSDENYKYQALENNFFLDRKFRVLVR